MAAIFDLKLLSISAGGLNIPEKTLAYWQTYMLIGRILHLFRRLLSELVVYRIYKITGIHKPIMLPAGTARRKGCPSFFSAKVTFELEDSKSDEEGRYLFLKGKIDRKQFTFTNVYCPNVKHAAFIQDTCDKLQVFKAGTKIPGGDFNVPISTILDSSSGTTAIPYNSLKHMKADMFALSLNDTWRTLHPSQKNYKFSSTPRTNTHG